MQTGTDQLKNQQEVLAAKNFYNGKIDGIWGPATIDAKLRWERGGKYSPAIPNNGLPLSEKGALPAGVRRLQNGMFTCPEMEAARAATTSKPLPTPPKVVTTPDNLPAPTIET